MLKEIPPPWGKRVHTLLLLLYILQLFTSLRSVCARSRTGPNRKPSRQLLRSLHAKAACSVYAANQGVLRKSDCSSSPRSESGFFSSRPRRLCILATRLKSQRRIGHFPSLHPRPSSLVLLLPLLGSRNRAPRGFRRGPSRGVGRGSSSTDQGGGGRGGRGRGGEGRGPHVLLAPVVCHRGQVLLEWEARACRTWRGAEHAAHTQAHPAGRT